MSAITFAPETRTTDDYEDYGFITADYETPVEGERPDPEVQRIRCDEQILAALVTF